jgi:hypothetical protein
MAIGKKPWLPYDPTADLAFGAKPKSFDLFTPPPDGQWQRESRRSKRCGFSANCEPIFDTNDSAGPRWIHDSRNPGTGAGYDHTEGILPGSFGVANALIRHNPIASSGNTVAYYTLTTVRSLLARQI